MQEAELLYDTQQEEDAGSARAEEVLPILPKALASQGIQVVPVSLRTAIRGQ
jgi:hypothetical protein